MRTADGRVHAAHVIQIKISLIRRYLLYAIFRLVNFEDVFASLL